MFFNRLIEECLLAVVPLYGPLFLKENLKQSTSLSNGMEEPSDIWTISRRCLRKMEHFQKMRQVFSSDIFFSLFLLIIYFIDVTIDWYF